MSTVMYDSSEICRPVFGIVAPHPEHWGHAALVGRDGVAAVLVCTNAHARAALGHHRVLHRYTALYNAAAARLVLAVPSLDGDTLLTALPPVASAAPALRVLAVGAGGDSGAASSLVLVRALADPAAQPVTLKCKGILSPLVVCSFAHALSFCSSFFMFA